MTTKISICKFCLLSVLFRVGICVVMQLKARTFRETACESHLSSGKGPFDKKKSKSKPKATGKNEHELFRSARCVTPKKSKP